MKTRTILFSISALFITGVTSAKKVENTINFTAVIEAPSMSIKPSTGSWPTAPIPIVYQPQTDSFAPYKLKIDVMSAASDVSAKLNAPAVLKQAGKSNIELDVTFGTHPLTLTPVKIHAKSASAASYEMTVSSKTKGASPGKYAGDVQLVFDAI